MEGNRAEHMMFSDDLCVCTHAHAFPMPLHTQRECLFRENTTMKCGPVLMRARVPVEGDPAVGVSPLSFLSAGNAEREACSIAPT